jgi:hypothetical protein
MPFCAAGISSFDNFWNAAIDAVFYFFLNHAYPKKQGLNSNGYPRVNPCGLIC